MHLEPKPTPERLAYDDACARAARLWRKADKSEDPADTRKAKEADAECEKLRKPLMRK